MRNTKFLFWGVVLFLLLFLSCEDENIEITPKHNHYLSEIYEHNHLKYKICYNDDFSIEKIMYYYFSPITDTIELDCTYVFEYDEGGVLGKMLFFNDDYPDPQIEVTLVYDNNNLVEKIILNESNYYKIEYNSNNQRNSFTQYLNEEYSQKTEYVYNSTGNISESTLYDPYIPYVNWIKSEYKYDNGNSPFHFMNEDIVYLIFTQMPKPRNNIIKSSFIESSGRTGETNITYVYNSDGFPIEEYGAGYYNSYVYIITE